MFINYGRVFYIKKEEEDMVDKVLKQKIVLKRVIETENKGLKTFIDEGYGIGTVEYIRNKDKDKRTNKYSLIDDIFIPTAENETILNKECALFDAASDKGNVHLFPTSTELAERISSDINIFRISLCEEMQGKETKENFITKLDDENIYLSVSEGNEILSKSGYAVFFNSTIFFKSNKLFSYCFLKYDNVEYQIVPFRLTKDENGFVSCRYHSIQFIRFIEGHSINFYPNSLNDMCYSSYIDGEIPNIFYSNPPVKFYNEDGKLNTNDIIKQFINFIIDCEKTFNNKESI